MKQLHRYLIAFVLLFLALCFYSYGSMAGLFVSILLGLLFEGAFWLKLFPRKKRLTAR